MSMRVCIYVYTYIYIYICIYSFICLHLYAFACHFLWWLLLVFTTAEKRIEGARALMAKIILEDLKASVLKPVGSMVSGPRQTHED